MGKVSTGFSMSLDGFIAGPNDEVDRVFAWMFRGDTEMTLTTGEHEIPLKVSNESAGVFEEASRSTGALVCGRRLFEVAGAWGGKHPLDVPVFVVTHRIPQEWVKEGSPFTFVTDGVESALAQARKVAGDKSVAIASANVLQQAINLGLLDEIHIDLVHILLGKGIRLFDHLGIEPTELDCTSLVQAPGVTHLDFILRKEKTMAEENNVSSASVFEMRLEVVPLPVSDIERAIAFYVEKVGFHLDHDVSPGTMRVVQLTPPGSACSIVFGTGMGEISEMKPGSVKGLHLVVKDVRKLREILLDRGLEVSEVVEFDRGIKYAHFSDPDGNSWELQEIPPNL